MYLCRRKLTRVMKEKFVVLLVAVVLVVLMFQLPRVVVNNDSGMEAEAAPAEQQGKETPHNDFVDPEITQRIDSVKRLWKHDDFSENNAIFASYLGDQYLQLSRYDSAITYFEWLNEHFPDRENKEKTANAYFQAFGFAMNTKQRQEYSDMARKLYQELIEESPEDLSLQNKLAMTYMAGTSPMEGIALLRKIIEKDPENAEALLNLGILAIQTNQYDRAEEHLTKLVEYHPEHWQGHLMLGAAMLEHGHKEEARQHFTLVKNKGDDPALVEAAGNYLKNIK